MIYPDPYDDEKELDDDDELDDDSDDWWPWDDIDYDD
jgi:hypothetical protein